MKKHFNTDIVVNGTFIAIVLFMITCYVLKVVHSYDYLPNSYTNYNNSNRPAFALSTQTPYSEYVQKLNEYNLLQDLRNGTDMGMSLTCVIIGTNQSSYCDTCTNYVATLGTNKPKRYYLTLPGWKLKTDPLNIRTPDTTIFYVKNGQAYVNTLVVQKEEMINKTINRVAKFKDIPVKFRYNRRYDFVMIPVSHNTYTILFYAIGALIIISATWVLYNILEFLRFTIAISKGNIFTWQNVFSLKLIALTLLIYPAATFALNWFIGFCLSGYFVGMATIKPLLWENWQLILSIGCVFLLLFKAFRKGTLLKEENDLTV